MGRMFLILLTLSGFSSCGIIRVGLVDYCHDLSRKEFYTDAQNCGVQADIDYYQACVREPLKTFSPQSFYDKCMEGKGWIK